jgi:integrase
MARPHKLWWWEQRGEYAMNLRGKRHCLGPDREAAEREFHRLLSEVPAKVKPQSVVAIMDLFLSEATFRSEQTRDWYQKHCQSFTDYLKGNGLAGMQLHELAPFHVHRWFDSHDGWSDGTKNGACRAVQRVFRWANQMGHIKVNPLAFIPDKPSPGTRENVIAPEEYETILSHVTDEDFRDLLVVSWECGCRPQESLRVEKRHVHLENKRWEFPVGEGKKTKRKAVRYVYLTENALAITKKRMLRFPQSPLFRNTEGNRWTPYSVNCRFVRLVKHIGRKVALYDFRHSFTERLRQAGVDSLNISALLGHADLSMLGRVYSHPHVSPDSLLSVLNKAVS